MKRVLALMLAALMLLGAAAADNMTQEYVDDPTEFVCSGTSASQSTDVWLQVTASGQIDVTVPLVVVFKTNIDGGSATTGDAYRIVNNSSAAIKVTEVKVTDVQEEFKQNGATEKMTAVESFTADDYNKYTLTMLPTDRYTPKVWDAARNVFASDGGFVQGDKTATLSASADAQAQGLWRIEKKDDAADTDESYIALTLSTSRLTFVTNQKSENEGAIENGVKLFSVAYTVKIDDSTAVGGDIRDDGANHEYQYPAA